MRGSIAPGGSRETSNHRGMRVRTSWLAAAAALVVAVLYLAIPATSSAYEEIRGDLGKASPCAKAGIGNGGGAAYRTYTDPKNPDNPVTVTLMCTPKKRFGGAIAALLVDDWLGGYSTFSGIGGGAYAPGVNPSFLHGPIADALRLADFKASQAIVDAIVGAGIGLGTSLATSLIICAAGGIPSLGIACAAAAAIVGSAVVATIVGAVGGVVKGFITAQVNRYEAAANAKWFVWMNHWGMAWNSVAYIDDTYFDPSMANARPCVNLGPFHCDPMKAQIGVQFTSASAGGGPDFFHIKKDGTLTAKGKAELAASRANASALGDIGEQIDSLNFNHGPLGIDPNGSDRVRTGTKRSNDVLRGGAGDDTLQGIGGTNRLHGRRGADTILGGMRKDFAFGGRRHDYLNGGGGSRNVLRGGRGYDTVIGGSGGGRNLLAGGRGADTLVDWDARTTVRTGRNRPGYRDHVNVRDGVGNDRVFCAARHSTVWLDRGDRASGHCGRLIRKGPVLKGG